ncbi:MAG: formylglycine-generating enzyme family protein [Planctomycetota bacterium]|nr:formylglycine-generating enzyme family protein [Planctomycetota bacterium]
MSIALISSPFHHCRPPTWASGYGQDRYGYFAEFSISTGPHYWQFINQRLRWIPEGSFTMGSPQEEEEEGRGNNEIPHEVSFARGFWLADTACTQEVWKAVTGANPSHFKNEEDSIQELPVETVSFDDVQAFLTQLNERIGKEATFSLPTEAQWEYACRAGTNTPFSFGESISVDQANFFGGDPYAGSAKGEYRQRTVAVKSLPCNSWGLYQMHGNVWEWCSDWYAEYSQDNFADPQGPDSGSDRVIRGGSWTDTARHVRSACRFGYSPLYRHNALGFRLLSSAS